MSELARRRAQVEMALVRLGDDLKVGVLARELGVSRWTVQRDVAYLRARWATLKEGDLEDLEAERGRTAALYEAAAAEAWEQYQRAAGESAGHGAGAQYLRLIVEAHEKRAKLLGLDRLPGHKQPGRKPIGPLMFVLREEDRIEGEDEESESQPTEWLPSLEP